MTESQETKTQSVEDIDHASDSGVLSKSHDSSAVLVHHLFVVDEPNVLQKETQKF